MQPPSSNSISFVKAIEANGYQHDLESAVESILLWTQATLVTDNSGGNLHFLAYIATSNITVYVKFYLLAL